MIWDEVEELAQTVRVKLWRALQKTSIANPKPYINHMMLFAVIDMVRKHHPVLSLTFDEDGELYQDGVLDLPDESIQDMACEIEQEEAFKESVQATCEALLALPPRQQYAMICSLKDHIDDVLPLMEMLRQHEINIDETHWPEEKSEMQKLRASLSVARKKLNPSKRKGE